MNELKAGGADGLDGRIVVKSRDDESELGHLRANEVIESVETSRSGAGHRVGDSSGKSIHDDP